MQPSSKHDGLGICWNTSKWDVGSGSGKGGALSSTVVSNLGLCGQPQKFWFPWGGRGPRLPCFFRPSWGILRTRRVENCCSGWWWKTPLEEVRDCWRVKAIHSNCRWRLRQAEGSLFWQGGWEVALRKGSQVSCASCEKLGQTASPPAPASPPGTGHPLRWAVSLGTWGSHRSPLFSWLLLGRRWLKYRWGVSEPWLWRQASPFIHQAAEGGCSPESCAMWSSFTSHTRGFEDTTLETLLTHGSYHLMPTLWGGRHRPADIGNLDRLNSESQFLHL